MRGSLFICSDFCFIFSRNHLLIKDDINYHEYFSEGLCGDRRSILVEIQSRRVVARINQHYQHADVGFEGAYAAVKGDIGSGKFRSVCMNVLWNEWEKRDGWEHILYTRLPLLPGVCILSSFSPVFLEFDQLTSLVKSLGF